MSDLHIVFPATDESALASMLRDITKAIEDARWGGPDGYGLGGAYGYGAEWDGEVFKMHRFCWCERDDCPWCCGCDCPDSAHHYYVDGQEVSYRAYADFFDRETYHKLSGGRIKDFSASLRHKDERFYTHEQWMEAAEIANNRRTTRHDPVCAFCKGEFPPADTGAIANAKCAPNFWHKPSGLRVWWYKYIGRGMEVHGDADLAAVGAECLAEIARLTNGSEVSHHG